MVRESNSPMLKLSVLVETPAKLIIKYSSPTAPRIILSKTYNCSHMGRGLKYNYYGKPWVF